MSSAARDPDDAGRLTLALLLALGLHAALLLGIPADRWSIRLAEPSRFEVVLLAPPRARPPKPPAVEPEPLAVEPEPPTATPEPATPEPMPGPPAAGSESALPAPQSAPAPPPAPPTVLPPAPAPPPELPASIRPAPPRQPLAPAVKLAPKPSVSAAKPAPKPPAAPAVKPAPKSASPTKPSTPTKAAPAPRVAIAPVAPVAPVMSPKPAKPPATPEAESPAQATIRSREPMPSRSKPDFSATAEPPPESGAAGSASANRRPERGPSVRGSAGAGGRGRLDSGALLGQIAGLEAETQRRANAGVRGKRVSPGDTQSPEGFYIAAWIRKVERIGEMNFPDIARKLNVSAGPVLDVAIRADGSLKEIRIARSSGHAELDRAAQNIVRLGAPYAPFPPQLRQQYDVLYIARPWRFEPDGRWQAR